MSSNFIPPHHLQYYNFSSGFSELPTPVAGRDGCGGGLAMWCEENFPLFDDINNLNGVGRSNNYYSMVPSSESSDITSSSVSNISFPDHQSESTHGCFWNMPEMMNMGFAAAGYLPPPDQPCEFPEEECSAFVPNIWPDFQAATTGRWESEGKAAETEESRMKIGRYSVEERKNRILKYIKKRNQRNFNKTIKYACRKTLADKRVRVRGRFAKNQETSEEDELTTTTHNNINNTTPHQDSFNSHAFQIKHDEEEDDWLEAVASFMYLPYVSG